MSILARLGALLGLGGQQKAPARVPTDEVLPVHWHDDTDMMRRLLCTWTMVFDDVLDADKLAAALSRLAEIGDWKKIGGRIRLNAQGNLELHVPEKFTPDRPAVEYTHETLDTAIDEHPLASRLPKPTPGPSLQTPSEIFHPLACPASAPQGIDDYLRTDRPQVGLHVVSFTDATVVTVTWPHILSDGMGLGALIRNWARVLDGREAEVEPLKGVHEVPYARLDAGPRPAAEEPYVLAGQVLRGLGMLVFAVRYIWLLVLGPKRQGHCIFLPAAAVAHLRERALRDLADAPGPAPPFLSDSDILAAWVVKTAAAGLGASPGRALGVFNIFEARGRLPSAFDPAAAYLGNLFFAAWTHLTVGRAAGAPLGRTAAALRASLAEQTTEAQVRAVIRLAHGPGRSAGTVMMAPGGATALFIACSSWAKARVLEVADFRAAVVREGGHASGRAVGPGRPVHFHGSSPMGARILRDCINILGKDARGNYYVMASFPEKTWGAFEEAMRALPGA